jgi:hypothetical protein
MANVKKKQEEAMACIDTSKAMVDKVVSIMEIVLVNPSLTLTFSTNPIGFLLQILKHLGITYEELRYWISEFLVRTLPALEIAVKAVLLTNLKNLISCSIDPRIPEKYRKQHKAPYNYNTSQEYGIDINIESIDFLDKLSVNPLSDYGSEMYFGLEGVEDSYKFARADDMDAFLWFVIHKGKFPNSAKIKDITELTNDVHGNKATQVLPSDGSLLSTLEVTYSANTPSSILPGNTFTYDKSCHVISMCYDRKLDDADNIVHNTLIPVSDDWSSVNWYARRADQLGKNLGFGWGVNKDTGNTKYKGKGRDFSKERAICNIQYIDQTSSDAPLTGLVNNKFRFTILPKPLVHIPNLGKGEPPWRFKRMLFNHKGEYDPNGKYTIANESDSTNLEYAGGKVRIDPKSGNVTVTSPTNLVKELMECYPGLTVFEFNYDYVMSIKLFDAKVLTVALLDSLINARLGINLSFNPIHQEGTDELREIIKNILETDDSEINDCYYTFDNSKYEALLRKAEEKRARQERFGNVTHEVGLFDSVRDILNEYDANAELHEQVDVLHRTITRAAVTVSDGVDDVDKYDVEYNFVFDLIEMLVTAIVNGILSPKVLMLLEVNQKIMGGTWEKFTMKDLLLIMRSLITAIVKEVRDLIIQELLKLVLKQLEPIIQMLSSILLREQLENYADSIMEIIRNCPFIWFTFGNKYEDTKLDTVDYADIDVSHTKEGEQPSTNDC